MKICGPFFLFLIASISLCGGELGFRLQDYRNEIDTLLSKLRPVEVTEGENRFIIKGPSSETQGQVVDRLLQIANESSRSRSQVIEAMIRTVQDQVAQGEWPVAYRWTVAVSILGNLKAREAVDVLVENICLTGENGFTSSLHYRPVARALTEIGEPAVPRLIKALGEPESPSRIAAASTLAEIGQPAFARLEKALSDGDAQTKTGAAMALAWIGGEEAKAAIERAIAREVNQAVVRELKEALTNFP